jgi:hypothetical protein
LLAGKVPALGPFSYSLSREHETIERQQKAIAEIICVFIVFINLEIYVQTECDYLDLRVIVCRAYRNRIEIRRSPAIIHFRIITLPKIGASKHVLSVDINISGMETCHFCPFGRNVVPDLDILQSEVSGTFHPK